jgi:hypothetical protein
MAAEARVDLHHGAPRCLLGLSDAAAGGLTDRGVAPVRVIGRSREYQGSGPGTITEGLAVLIKVCARDDLSRSPGFQDLRVVEELPIDYNDV